ncbi:hypothetical protein J422_03808 [Methanocaldococcus villosus KIN24-T80]|uniref:CDP-archaeol synthase n=1 Tax=Methanocaldococcus villosus KIN24-T80 TaxID=1069083 RepID=N6VYF5_9EURY|nr:CDP-2,3-bis-(O-geranylgeranyl)-sn-glycerol synthase [Methanocaldococcus villosus]ENN96152.1 hypothetical protein J422_03808 [Methanocaldococcus villosus KIN24-T80]
MKNIIISSIWYILPAYVANASACIFGGGSPLDNNAYFFDGKRILGDGVTYRGCFFGILFGTLTGIIQSIIHYIYFKNFTTDYIILAFLLSFGAIFGDAVGSFIKRRINIERGKPAPLLDQLDFVIFAIIFGSIIKPISFEEITVILILTVFIHILGNVIAYLLKIKDVWW